MYITDGNAMYYAQVALPSTLGELAEYLFEQLPKEKRVVFVTYSYHTLSVKGIERDRRGSLHVDAHEMK